MGSSRRPFRAAQRFAHPDGQPEFGISSLNHFGVYETDQSLLWVADIVDTRGQAGGTAFDFLGQGRAQAIYAHENNMWVFDDEGTILMSTPRSSGTRIEYHLHGIQ